jgi:citrate lyase gamma subunit
MSWFGTDVVALGCILGGAAVSGAVTGALIHGDEQADMGCGIEAMALSPRIAISHGGDAHAIVVAPNLRVRAPRGCVRNLGRAVEINLDSHLEQMDAQLEHLDRALEIQLQQLESQLEAEFGQQIEARVQIEEAMRQMEAARIKVVVREQGSGSI